MKRSIQSHSLVIPTAPAFLPKPDSGQFFSVFAFSTIAYLLLSADGGVDIMNLHCKRVPNEF